jgi:hypothetical protein
MTRPVTIRPTFTSIARTAATEWKRPATGLRNHVSLFESLAHELTRRSNEPISASCVDRQPPTTDPIAPPFPTTAASIRRPPESLLHDSASAPAVNGTPFHGYPSTDTRPTSVIA